MNIQEQGASDQETAREESESPQSAHRKGTQARDYIEHREYDTFIDGDAPQNSTAAVKHIVNNSATATTNYYTSKNNSTGEQFKHILSCESSFRENVVSDFGQYVEQAN